MREIKYKAYDPITKKVRDVASIDFDTHEITLKDNPWNDIKSFNDVEVMEYTGVTDCLGNEIYEGCLVKSERSNNVYPVVFFKGAFMVDYDGFYESVDEKFASRCKVIGDIYTENKPDILYK